MTTNPKRKRQTNLARGRSQAVDSSTVVDKKRGTYYPATEELRPDEMRVTALGTGMPVLRPSQMSASWFVELGNGDNFFFDMGTGSIKNFSALGVAYQDATNLFLTHLHSDHVGDFPLWWIGGWITRQTPVNVWGPSGKTRELGTKYCIDKFAEAYTWDITSRTGELPDPGKGYRVTEFDYKAMNKVVYKKNGVTIRSWPQLHAIDGAVAYSLEWNGFKFVYGGDGRPSDLFVKYSQNTDLLIHECFLTEDLLMRKFGFSKQMAKSVGTVVHTSPEQCGYIFSQTKPRLAVAYHFFNDFETVPEIGSHIRKTYKGPLSLAKDLHIYNITKKNVIERKVAYDPDNWPSRSKDYVDPRTLPMGKKTPMSKWLLRHAIRLDE